MLSRFLSHVHANASDIIFEIVQFELLIWFSGNENSKISFVAFFVISETYNYFWSKLDPPMSTSGLFSKISWKVSGIWLVVVDEKGVAKQSTDILKYKWNDRCIKMNHIHWNVPCVKNI